MRPVDILGLVLEHNPPFSWVKQSEEGNIVAYGIGVYILEDLLNSYDIRARRRIKSTETREDLENQTWKKAVDTAVGIQYYPSLRSDIQDNFLHPAYMSNPIVAVFAKGKEKKLRSSSDLVGMNGAYIKSDHIDFLFSKEILVFFLCQTRNGLILVFDKSKNKKHGYPCQQDNHQGL